MKGFNLMLGSNSGSRKMVVLRDGCKSRQEMVVTEVISGLIDLADVLDVKERETKNDF